MARPIATAQVKDFILQFISRQLLIAFHVSRVNCTPGGSLKLLLIGYSVRFNTAGGSYIFSPSPRLFPVRLEEEHAREYQFLSLQLAPRANFARFRLCCWRAREIALVQPISHCNDSLAIVSYDRKLITPCFFPPVRFSPFPSSLETLKCASTCR